MEIIPTAIEDVKILIPRVFKDNRGYFTETYVKDRFAEVCDREFVQDNQSQSIKKGTIRGLHFQKPPFAQGKLVRVLCGAILDVAVDLRQNSPTFGKWVCEILSEDNFKQLWIPRGFAHGFVTLAENTIVSYKVDAPYNQKSEGGIIFDDPVLAINWGIDKSQATLSDKDLTLPKFSQLEQVF